MYVLYQIAATSGRLHVISIADILRVRLAYEH